MSARDDRTLVLQVRVSPRELVAIRRAARSQDETASSWARSVLSSEAAYVLTAVPREVID